MRNLRKTFVFYILFAIGIIQSRTPHTLILTFEAYPEITQSHKPLSWSTNTLFTQGIYATYFGFLGLTNTAGQIIFPRSQQTISFTLVVTQHIKPIFMLHNTISTWSIAKGNNYNAFKITRIQDHKTGLYLWNIEKTDLPKNLSLPLDAITIFAKPDEIYIPVGVSVTENTPQLSLPTFFVKNHISLTQNALFVLNYRQFFESIERSFKTQNLSVQSKF